MITSHKPAAGYKLLEFDECYAICRSVEVVNSRGLKTGEVQATKNSPVLPALARYAPDRDGETMLTIADGTTVARIVGPVFPERI